jgi:glycosyltransferase involved in cell wall biosynthesis
MLEKGVQYIYRALRQRPGLPVRMEFFGGISLTPEGVARLAEVGTVHGPVHRSRLLADFRRADVLLLPSLSEGSALVTLEAAALGLPVVATGEAGAPASAMLIPARDPDAIVAALEELADDPARLGKLSAAGLAEATRRNVATYDAAVTESARTLLA